MEYNVMELLAELVPEELPAPYCDIASAVDMKTALHLAMLYQGAHLYFPKLDDVIRSKRNEKIRAEFTGYNFRELAIKYNVTDRWIRELVCEPEDENQIKLGDLL